MDTVKEAVEFLGAGMARGRLYESWALKHIQRAVLRADMSRGVAGKPTEVQQYSCGPSRSASPSPEGWQSPVCAAAAGRAARAGAGEGASVTGTFNDLIGAVKCE